VNVAGKAIADPTYSAPQVGPRLIQEEVRIPVRGGGYEVAATILRPDGQGPYGAVILNHGVTVDHDCRVGDFAHLSPGVHTGGEVTVGTGSHLAVGVSVRNRVAIGSWSVVGVGAAVVADVPANVVALGVPARVVRSSPVAGEERSARYSGFTVTSILRVTDWYIVRFNRVGRRRANGRALRHSQTGDSPLVSRERANKSMICRRVFRLDATCDSTCFAASRCG
jgi:carbonic anhydrase/acetyltransferase-like protein (isoleucine patch superfamily)